jgi:flagellar hook-associated protein 1 FlgK
MQPGNTLTLTVTDKQNVTRNIILVASSASPLPTIAPGQTNDAGALTAAFDISNGPSGYAGAIQAALDKLTASNPALPTFNVTASTSSSFPAAAIASGGVVSIGMTAPTPNQAIVGATAGVTTPISAQDTKTGYPQLAFFTDGSNKLFTGTFDSGSQLTGLAQRLGVNGQLINDSSALTISSASNTAASSVRSLQIFNSLVNTQRTFSSSSGIGGITAPYTSTVIGFAQNIISAQGANANNADSLNSTQQVALSTAQGRFSASAGVNIDAEMSNLIALQTAYGANARVLTAARDMLNQLLQI